MGEENIKDIENFGENLGKQVPQVDEPLGEYVSIVEENIKDSENLGENLGDQFTDFSQFKDFPPFKEHDGEFHEDAPSKVDNEVDMTKVKVTV
ncbi:hypothetical protein L6452_40669 [Arctium lappa]|uniref:Uncharacterized protein n=1 Tax=Arctium lappa TaxID=4217 RepID=A0ACB8XMJ0_ARCLA|nr:hypothetical protein L6452_40669 [Arctium lappa]